MRLVVVVVLIDFSSISSSVIYSTEGAGVTDPNNAGLENLHAAHGNGELLKP